MTAGCCVLCAVIGSGLQTVFSMIDDRLTVSAAGCAACSLKGQPSCVCGRLFCRE